MPRTFIAAAQKLADIFAVPKTELSLAGLAERIGPLADAEGIHVPFVASVYMEALRSLLRAGEIGASKNKVPGEVIYFAAAESWESPCSPPIALLQRLARDVGYSIAVHGSEVRDFDVIAIPWNEDVIGSQAFIKHMVDSLEAELIGGPEVKPHGRIAISLRRRDRWEKIIDMSVMPISLRQGML